MAHDNPEDIPLGNGDPWEGLGMDGETLEAKVVSTARGFICCLLTEMHRKRSKGVLQIWRQRWTRRSMDLDLPTEGYRLWRLCTLGMSTCISERHPANDDIFSLPVDFRLTICAPQG